MGWYREWPIEVNGEKCGVMHTMRKGVKRTEECFETQKYNVARQYNVHDYPDCLV